MFVNMTLDSVYWLQVEELRLSERVLRSRVKNLTKEISICKKVPIATSSKKLSYQRSHTSSTERGECHTYLDFAFIQYVH